MHTLVPFIENFSHTSLWFWLLLICDPKKYRSVLYAVNNNALSLFQQFLYIGGLIRFVQVFVVVVNESNVVPFASIHHAFYDHVQEPHVNNEDATEDRKKDENLDNHYTT